MSIQYEDSNITMKYLKRVYPYITPYYIGGGGRCLRMMSRMSPPPLHRWSCPARRSQGWPVPGPIFRHARLDISIYLHCTHTRKLVIKVFIHILSIVCCVSPYHLGLSTSDPWQR